MQDVKILFPLKGKWQVLQSNSDQTQSVDHAYRFIKSEDLPSSIFSKLKTKDIERTISWRQDVLAPCSGKVVAICNNKADKLKTSIKQQLINSPDLSITDKKEQLGNYVIIKCESYYCLLANLKQNSIKVEFGALIEQGESIAQIGLSDTSIYPNLFIQLLDDSNLETANSLPAFFDLKVETSRQWENKEYCLPALNSRIQALND